MKSWWDYYPVMIIAVIIPFIPGGLPTVALKGHYYGGGPVRQFLINKVAMMLPHETGQSYVDAFNAASVGKEYVLYMPIALNLSAGLVVFTFLMLTLKIQIENWMKRSEFSSQRKASKGA